jgi:hypothetical protein
MNRDEGRGEGALTERKRTLVEQLRLSFNTLPAETEQVIAAT